MRSPLGIESTTGQDRNESAVDWSSIVKLGLVVSVVAAMLAVTFAGRLSETVIILSVIVAATAASWHQIERGPEPARVRVRQQHRHG